MGFNWLRCRRLSPPKQEVEGAEGVLRLGIIWLSAGGDAFPVVRLNASYKDQRMADRELSLC